MIKMICDKCGNDCNVIGYDILIRVLHNPEPVSMTDTGYPSITDDNTSIRMVLCQGCYKKMGLPNPYTALRDKSLIFRD